MWCSKNKFVCSFLITGFILINLGFLLSFLKFKNYDNLIVEYVNPIGVILVDNFYYLLYIWITALIICLINLSLIIKINSRDLFLSKFFAVFSFFINLLIFIYFLAIININ